MKKLVVFLVALSLSTAVMANDPIEGMVEKALESQTADVDQLAAFYDAVWGISDFDPSTNRATTFSVSKAYSRTLDLEVACVGPSVGYGGSDPEQIGGNGQNFIILGYIYPAGTLEPGTGVNPDGTAEFPEARMGIWICSGYIFNGVAITDLRFFMGPDQLAVSGQEPGFNFPSTRPIVGGTNTWQLARGQVTQTITGPNASGAPNFTFHFEFHPFIDFKR